MKNRNQLLGENIVSLSICYQKLSARINRAVDPLNINMTQISILSHFSWDPSMKITIGELALVMDMNQPAVTKAVKALVEKQALTKQADENDGRIVHLSITDEGLQLLNRAREASFPVIGQGFAGLDDGELEHLNNLLLKVKKEIS